MHNDSNGAIDARNTGDSGEAKVIVKGFHCMISVCIYAPQCYNENRCLARSIFTQEGVTEMSETKVYHVGNLAWDRQHDKGLHKLASDLHVASSLGSAFLTQKRLKGGSFEYRVTAAKRAVQ